MRLVAGWATDVGLVRAANEDSYLVDDALGVFAVADGMGGHAAGEIASSTAVEALRAALARGDDVVTAVLDANAEVFSRAHRQQSLAGMGTTLTVAVTEGGRHLRLGHVGDSRAYLLRDGVLDRLTDDHSMVEELLRAGRITAEEAAVHPQRNIVTRAIGISPLDLEVDTRLVEVAAGDRVMLCSDGLSGLTTASELQSLLDDRTCSPQEAATRLVDLALAHGGDDNVTVVVIDVEEVDDTAPTPRGGAGARPEPSTAHTGAAEPTPEVPGAASTDSADSPGGLDTRVPRRRGRAVLWLLATTVPLVLLLVGAWFGLRAWNDHQFHVGVHDSHLALFRGSADAPFGWDPVVLTEASDVQVSRIQDEAQRAAIEHNKACVTSSEATARRCFAEQRNRALNPGTTS